MKMTNLICKARRKDNGEWVEGFYFCLHHNDERTHLHHFIIPLETDLSRGTPLDHIQVEVVPESITLKAQEPVRPKFIDGKRNHIILCGNCNTDLIRGVKFCSYCGRAVKWE